MHELGWSGAAICGGLALLVGGAELLVRGASQLATALRISPLVIGLTVVAFGTSAPELAVSVQAAWNGNADVAVGNVVGSNIFNVLFILGISAAIVPLVVSSLIVRRDVPLMVLASLLIYGFSLDHHIRRWEGGLLLVGIATYTVGCIRQSRRESSAIQSEFASELPRSSSGARAMCAQITRVILGLVLLTGGSRLLVSGAVAVATSLDTSELMIGLTIVAAGTSLPELVTSIVAAVRGERDIAVGNVVGSNIFNLLCVLGLSGVISPHGVTVSSTAVAFDIPVMIAVAAACLPVFFTGHMIARWEGSLFLAYYLAYTSYLILDATGHEHGRSLREAMLGFIIPLTVVTLAVSTWRSLREQRASECSSTQQS